MKSIISVAPQAQIMIVFKWVSQTIKLPITSIYQWKRKKLIFSTFIAVSKKYGINIWWIIECCSEQVLWLAVLPQQLHQQPIGRRNGQWGSAHHLGFCSSPGNCQSQKRVELVYAYNYRFRMTKALVMHRSWFFVADSDTDFFRANWPIPIPIPIFFPLSNQQEIMKDSNTNKVFI